MSPRLRALAPLLLAASACASPPAPSPPAQSPSLPLSNVPDKVREIGADAPIEDGHVAFQGMVRPTKGGYDVRGVLFDGDAFRQAIARDKRAEPAKPDWFLGAVVRADAEVANITPPLTHPEEPEQARTGPGHQAQRIHALAVVAPAQMIEGTLGPSKGLLSLGQYMLTRQELDWALAPGGAGSGDRVRVYGQPREYVCKPGMQCLNGGSIPFFDVGRAERLP